MRKSYIYLTLTALALLTTASVVYAQQISGKGAGSVINVKAFERIHDEAEIDLNAFLACSRQGLLLKDGHCILVPPPQSEWVTTDELRWQNPSEAPSPEVPDPTVWGDPVNLKGPAGQNGTYCYTDKAPHC